MRAGRVHCAGRLPEAKLLYEQAVALARQKQDRAREIQAQVGLGAVAWHLEDMPTAQHNWSAAKQKAHKCSPLRERLCEIGIENSRRTPTSTPP